MHNPSFCSTKANTLDLQNLRSYWENELNKRPPFEQTPWPQTHPNIPNIYKEYIITTHLATQPSLAPQAPNPPASSPTIGDNLSKAPLRVSGKQHDAIDDKILHP